MSNLGSEGSLVDFGEMGDLRGRAVALRCRAEARRSFETREVLLKSRFDRMRQYLGVFPGCGLEWYAGSVGMLRDDAVCGSGETRMFVLLSVERRALDPMDSSGSDGRRGLVMNICDVDDFEDMCARGEGWSWDEVIDGLGMAGGLYEVRSDEFVLVMIGDAILRSSASPTSSASSFSSAFLPRCMEKWGRYSGYPDGGVSLVEPTHMLPMSDLGETCQICMEDFRGPLCVPTVGSGLTFEGTTVVPCCGRLIHSRCLSQCYAEELRETVSPPPASPAAVTTRGRAGRPGRPGRPGRLPRTSHRSSGGLMGWGEGRWMVCASCRGVMFPMTGVHHSTGYLSAMGP